MNILTDVLSLIRRGIFAKIAGPEDYLVLGVNEEPDMTGVASPIPYRSIKLIKVRDFKVAANHCAHANSPLAPAAGTGQVYQKTVVDPTTLECTVYFRSLKSLSSNLTLAESADDDYVEITTTGEPNTAANVGSGAKVWKNKVGETLNFRTLVEGSGVTIAESTNEITISATGGGGATPPAGADTEVQYNNSGAFGAGSFFTTNKSSKVDVTYELGLIGDGTNQGLLKLYCEAGTPHYVGLKGPNHSGGSSYTLQLPNTLPNVTNQILESNASGILSWIATPSGGGGGEVNTASNVGSGTGVFKQKTGVDLEFKSLTSLGGTVTITQTATIIDLAAVSESFDVSSVIASGKAYMQYVAGSDGTAAMTGNNYKMMGQEEFTNAGLTTIQYSPYIHDWTNQIKFMNLASSWLLSDEALWNGSIPLGKALAIGDSITLNWVTTNTTVGAGQTFNAAIGWYDCVDLSPWPVNLRDVVTGNSLNASVGAAGKQVQYQCASITTTITAATSTGYAVVGFNFGGGYNNDQYNVQWSISVSKAK